MGAVGQGTTGLRPDAALAPVCAEGLGRAGVVSAPATAVEDPAGLVRCRCGRDHTLSQKSTPKLQHAVTEVSRSKIQLPSLYARIDASARRQVGELRNYVTANMPNWDIEAHTKTVFERVYGLTKVSRGRLVSIVDSITYVCKRPVAGDIVECGVWRGGSVMAAAMTLIEQRQTDRLVHLYDTFAGMTASTDIDTRCEDGTPASSLLTGSEAEEYLSVADLSTVKENLRTTGYPESRLTYHVGPVECTASVNPPATISYLRLDMDLYEPTLHALQTFYPLLQTGGILIVDDYGWWEGARAATNEYFTSIGQHPFMARLAETRVIVKPGAE